ncbi:MAG: NUDIX domain-containing protein [Anaerolineaceae bacterium]|nr:NUDIX domain-containing protein [Anaerolineaceae bacterium]
MKHEKSCGAIVFCHFEDGLKVLLLKHRAGHWDFPKGHVEEKESEAETALREVAEESGLCITLDQNFREVISYSPKFKVNKQVVYFLGHCLPQQASQLRPQHSEVLSADFVPFSIAEQMITFENARQVFHKALGYLNGMALKEKP